MTEQDPELTIPQTKYNTMNATLRIPDFKRSPSLTPSSPTNVDADAMILQATLQSRLASKMMTSIGVTFTRLNGQMLLLWRS